VISCRQLTRKFGDFTAVDSISLEVAKGAICAVLGPNGAGKSTTVSMLTGLLAITSGDAMVCGLNVSHDSVGVKRKIGVLPEDLGLFEDLTIEEHLELTGDIYGLGTAVTRERIEPLLAALGLTPETAADPVPGHVQRVAEHARAAEELLAGLRSMPEPSAGADEMSPGEAWAVAAGRQRDSVLQPPEPLVPTAPQITQPHAEAEPEAGA